MARLNSVLLYGCVADMPKVTKTSEGAFVRGFFHLATVRSTRYSGETFGEKDRILYDWPIILSTDPEMVAKMSRMRQYDIVEVSGVFLTRKIKKVTYCKACGEKNITDGNICFVHPIFMERRNTEKTPYTEKQAIQEVIKNRPISNIIHIAGNLCGDVVYYKQKAIETAVYQIATDRRYYVRSDPAEIKTDYPMVRSYGKNAKQDSLCIHQGSGILVDGFLHSREFERKSKCSVCGEEYIWQDNTIEIIPYATEYLSNYTDPETARKEEEERALREGEALTKSL